MATEIMMYPQARPSEWLKENPDKKWRCDIYANDGSHHHGEGQQKQMRCLTQVPRIEDGPIQGRLCKTKDEQKFQHSETQFQHLAQSHETKRKNKRVAIPEGPP